MRSIPTAFLQCLYEALPEWFSPEKSFSKCEFCGTFFEKRHVTFWGEGAETFGKALSCLWCYDQVTKLQVLSFIRLWLCDYLLYLSFNRIITEGINTCNKSPPHSLKSNAQKITWENYTNGTRKRYSKFGSIH